jgi:hypothetical protein
MEKRGYAHLCIGGTGTGKTTYVKAQIKNKSNVIVYDVNNEYREQYPYPFLKHGEFMSKIILVQNSVIVLEESTIFFSNRSYNEELTEMLVRKRHTGNYIFLCFHSLRAVPRYVWDLCNYLTLFPTNDNEAFVKTKIPNDEVYKAFRQVRENKGLTKLAIPGTKKYVKFTTVSLY